MTIKELLTRGVAKIIAKEELEKALKLGKKLRIYYGVDPSGPVIHLGHALALRKLAYLQEMGHKIIFLIGDFTGMIGDPTDRLAARKPLTRQQVLANAKTYKKQIKHFIKFSGKNPAEIKFNSSWNDKLNFKHFIELASQFTVQQLLERDMFQERLKKRRPIHLHEFIYPVIQAYDAVMLDADVQIGGTDQTFNMLAGRELMRSLKGKTHTVVTLEILEGPDGRKMSKSFGNIISVLEEPNNMYGKIMSLPDELIIRYFKLATEVPLAKVRKLESELRGGRNPRDLKKRLAFEVTKIYHGQEKARKAGQEFERVFIQGKLPSKIPYFKIKGGNWNLTQLLVKTNLASSKSEARRLIEQRGVKVDGVVIRDVDKVVGVYSGMVVQVGKRKFVKLKI